MFAVNRISSTAGPNVTNISSSKAISMKANPDNDLETKVAEDTFEKPYKAPTDKEKDQIIYDARKNAAGWSILGGGISVLYYYLRSNKKVAEKFNLDEKKDKQFIEELKEKQALAALPGFFGAGIVGWLAFKYFAKPE